MEKVIYDATKDPRYSKPVIDQDETRERDVSGVGMVPYRYVHGYFEGTDAKFVFCFPEKDKFKGRFFQYLCPFPGPDEEVASLNRKGEDDIIAFCLKYGTYFVETNMESKAAFGGHHEPHLIWKSSAAAAEYSRQIAMEYYGCSRPFGYVFGGSGGGYKSIACIENTNAWDGACPFVIGSPYSLPNSISMHVQGMRTLRNVFPKIIDALDAGGSGDMYEGLTEDEAKMLREVTLMGYPPKAWFIEAAGRYDDGSLPVLLPGIKAMDPTYFEDFWTVPGYMGADPDSNACRDRIQFQGSVRSIHLPGEAVKDEDANYNGVDTAWKKSLQDAGGAWIEMEDVPAGDDLYLKGVTITFLTGAAEGKRLLLGDIKDNCILLGTSFGMDDAKETLSLVQQGDQLSLDNSDYIAAQSYYRHQAPEDNSFHAWDQFRDEKGEMTLPQRSISIGPGFCGTGTVQEGTIQGKVIVTQSLMDESTWPWCGDWYRNRVKAAQGNEDNFRLYYYDRCMHGDVSALETNMIVNYLGGLHQALLDLSDWVERGIEPRVTSGYKMDGGNVLIAEKARDRKGLQPVALLTANGAELARVKVGETVELCATAEVPENAGEVTNILFAKEDPMFGSNAHKDTTADYQKFLLSGKTERIEGEIDQYQTEDGLFAGRSVITTTYDQPGTYFATAFVYSQKDGDREDVFTQVKNLARARIIVEE